MRDSEFVEKLVAINRITKVVKGGRRFGFAALVVVGNQKGSIGDMLTRIRNGQMRSLNIIDIPFSNFRLKILEVLKKEGYIINFNTVNEKENKSKKSIKVDLKYYEGQPVIREIKRISKPGRRVYSRADSIPRVHGGLGLAILSTSKGVMSDSEAIKNNLGGEVICRVF